jgi:hypothetical protein
LLNRHRATPQRRHRRRSPPGRRTVAVQSWSRRLGPGVHQSLHVGLCYRANSPRAEHGHEVSANDGLIRCPR